MGSEEPPRFPDLENSKQRPGKSVRWTERDVHHHNTSRTSSDGDYFTYSGGSANLNQTPSSSSASNEVDNSSSDSNVSDEEEHDEDSQHFRAATRANTWFNRLRQEEQDTDEVVESDDNDICIDEGSSPLIPSPHSTSEGNASGFIPSIQVSDHTNLHPYSNIMDIGTKVSAGLAPGSRELTSEDMYDPIDNEYRQRRDRMLASLGTRSLPTSPQLEISNPLDAPDPTNVDAIPLTTLKPPQPKLNLPDNNISPRTRSQSPPSHGPVSHSNQVSEQDLESDPAIAAEALKAKLQAAQSQRVQNMEKVLAARRKKIAISHERHGSSSSSGDSYLKKEENREADASSIDTSSTSSSQNSDEEELRRLEVIAREEAETQAKLLVKSHLGTNLLSTKNANNGYVENSRYLLDAGLMDEDIPLGEDSDPDAEDHKGKSDRNKHNAGESSNSTETLSDEKAAGESKSANDSSDSESGSDNETGEKPSRHFTMRGDPDYVPPPKMVKEGVLGSLLRLYAGQEDDSKSVTSSMTSSSGVSQIDTPLHTPQASPEIERPESVSPEGSVSTGKRWKRPDYFRTRSSEDATSAGNKNRPKWFKRPSSANMSTLGKLASTAGGVASTAASNVASSAHLRSHSTDVDSLFKPDKKGDLGVIREKEARKKAKKLEQKRKEKEKAIKKARLAEQARITVHIADVLQRQRFLLRLGRALMLFGAPSHRLEEYLKITARVLEIDAQVLYMPGCMLVSFGDATTHTSETKLLKVVQGLNLNKLHATHLIYKEVVHDLMSIEEASSHIDHLLRSRNIYPWYLVCIFYGLATVCCGMFAYGARWKDMPIIFVLGGGVGFLQYWVQPKSDLYANIFEVSSSIVVSFIGRAFGSIWPKNPIFCFSAIVQASLALILPGYIILVGALELQSKNLVAGSVRMFYANIYSLFLSFGITLGSAIYGWIDKNAITETTCRPPTIDAKWKILFVPMATLFMAAVNQAGPRQLPVMVVLGSAGYAVQYFVQQQVKTANAFTSAIGAFTLGVGGNLYSRVGHGLAFAAMLPGIFVLVPSGVAAQGSLVAGVRVAEEIVKSNKTSTSTDLGSTTINQLGNTMTQVAVGIVVGLFAATLVVYPLGFKKKRSGLFTF